MLIWRQFTETERRAKQRSHSRRTVFLTTSAAVALFYTFATYPDANGGSLGGLALPMPELFPDLERGVVLAALLLTMGICYRMTRAEAKRNQVKICQQCNLVKFADGQTQCRCGGEFLGLNEMKWVETLRMPVLAACPAGEAEVQLHPATGGSL